MTSYIDSQNKQGRGAGLLSVSNIIEAALTGAGLDVPTLGSGVPVESMPVGDCLGSRFQPFGDLLLQCQGHADLRLAQHCAVKLAGRMAANGRPDAEQVKRGRMMQWPAQWRDAVGEGVLAVMQWRADGGAGERLASRVCWRAIVEALSNDTFGEGESLSTVEADWLWRNAAMRDASRQERAAALWIERAQGLRLRRLERRIGNLPPGRGKRQALIDKVHRATIFLLQGETLDKAAESAGFCRKSDRTNGGAGDTFVQACKRLGLPVGAVKRGKVFELPGDPANRHASSLGPDSVIPLFNVEAGAVLGGFTVAPIVEAVSTIPASVRPVAIGAAVQGPFALESDSRHSFKRIARRSEYAVMRWEIANRNPGPPFVEDGSWKARRRLHRALVRRGLRASALVPVQHVEAVTVKPRVKARAILRAFDSFVLRRAIQGNPVTF